METDTNLQQRVNEWLTPAFDSQTHQEIAKLLGSPNELKESFYKNLEFGTGGMRGIMGVGTNRINKYTLGKNTQGLSDYLKTSFPGEQPKVVIAYDCRHNSDTLAKVVADVFSANGIKAYLFSALRPTPELSFALKYLSCHCGIVLTASHNPPEYNGYKVYWQDGGQLVPPQDHELIAVIEAIKYEAIKFTPDESLIEYIDKKIDDAFIDSTISNASFNTAQDAKDRITIVFTSLHGTSITVVPPTLEKAGYKNVHIVAEQSEPNGNFPTVKSPNPEEPEALTMALALADRVDADIVVGTDPDCDRLGVAVRDNDGEMMLLNGNQTMILMTHFLLENWQKQGRINGKQFIGSTIVSTPMMREIAETYGVECKLGLTGFKWIAKMIKDFPDLEFIGGGEESFGYMVGDAVRDKDAVSATLLICEIAAIAKASGSSVYQELLKIYIEFGFYKEYLVSLTKKGIDGLAEIAQMMESLRNNPLKEINGQRVVMIEDYEFSVAKNLITGDDLPIDMPRSNVLIYELEDGTRICARPSGTEPKIKFYFSANDTLDNVEDAVAVEEKLDNKIRNIIGEMKLR